MAYITLDSNRFYNNLDIIAKLTKTKDKIALVLKDNAYGHGLIKMATLARDWGITKAVVQLESEAQIIADFFEYILILADTPKEPHEKFCYTINSLHTIHHYPKGSRVELKVNSGMNRNGIEFDEMEEAFRKITQQGLKLEAVFSHHGCADELNGFYEKQTEQFLYIKEKAQQLALNYNIKPLRFHLANSAALFREDECREDMVRVGIAAYGCLELPFPSRADELQPMLSLYADKITSRHLKAGECVGYGATFQAPSSMVVSTYDVGYGDGFLRHSSQGYTTPDGISLAGRISMDNSSFATDKDTLLIFNDARDVAQSAHTISYEILTSLKPSLQRTIIS